MSESSTAAESGILACQEPTMPIDIIAGAGEQQSIQDKLRKLEEELQVRTEEKENFKNKLQAAEKEIADLKNAQAASIGDAESNESMKKLIEDNNSLREALTKAADLIKDKTSLCVSQERQNIALSNQVVSLKEVVSITKDLLNIRNMEVKHLQSDVDGMENKIKAERVRHNAMISKMDEAIKLNADLKNEYENQLKIFQDLKARYEEKVQLLENENKKHINCVNHKSNEPQETSSNNKNPESNVETVNKPINKISEKKFDKRVESVTSDDNIEGSADEFVDAHEDIAGN